MGVQTEGKIGGGRSCLRRASGDRLFFLKCAEGKALSFWSEGSKPFGQDRPSGLDLREPGPVMPDAREKVTTINEIVISR